MIVNGRVVRRLIIALFLLIAAASAQTSPDFESTVRPFVSQYCSACHNSTAKVGGLDLTTLGANQYDGWEKARTQLKAGSMPPQQLR